jgi:preprotein translocase subunit YajC
MGPLIVLILLFFVMYTVMIRPQQRRAREHQALIAAVEVGEEVMTTAGIFGTVTFIDGDVIGIEIAPGTVMRVARAAIGRRILPDDFEEEAELEEPAAFEENAVFDEPEIEEPVVEEPQQLSEPKPFDGGTVVDESGPSPEPRPGDGDAPRPGEPS